MYLIWSELSQRYFASYEFERLHISTKKARRRILESTSAEPLEPGSPHKFGQMPVHRFGREAIEVLRGRKADLPEAANGRIKAISTVFAWALKTKQPGIDKNPAIEVDRISNPSDGHHTWTADEVDQFEAAHPVGTKARLAMALMLYVGLRRSDVVRIGRPHVTAGELYFTAKKNRDRKPVKVEIPILPELQQIIDASQTGAFTFLVTEYGRPFSDKGFGGWFKKQCVKAGLLHCSPHGLRKAGSTRAAENGATPHELMAMYGWSTLQQAEVYTKNAERRRLARSGMDKIVRASRQNKA